MPERLITRYPLGRADALLQRLHNWMPGAPPQPDIWYAPSLNTYEIETLEQAQRLAKIASGLAGVASKISRDGLESIGKN